jgi:hypothetical protein
VTFSTTSAAGTSEWTLDLVVGAVGLVVASLTAVEALARHLTRLGALAREVARLTTAVIVLVKRSKVHCDDNSLATGIISRGAIVLGDGLGVNAQVVGVHASSSSVFDPGGGIGSDGRFVPARSCNRVSDVHWTR